MRLLKSTGSLLVATAFMVGCGDTTTPEPPEQFSAFPLEAAQEVHDVTSEANGFTNFQANAAGTQIVFDLGLAQITDVTQAHIHVGERGANGPIIVDLAILADLDAEEGEGQDFPGDEFQLANSGNITEEDISAQEDAGFDGSMESLVELMRNGGAYVNVHTVQEPMGEVRGQIEVGLPE